MHTGGDMGIDQFLDLAEEMGRRYPDLPERRWAMDHCRFINDRQAARIARLKIQLSCGPKYVYAGERGDIGAFKILFGEDVSQDVVVPWRRLLDHGVRAVMELDQHGFHPFLAMEVSVTRQDINGKVWGPEQRINRREALYTYTRWSAEYVLKENLVGSIETGKAADFVVLNKDFLSVPDEEIGQIDPVWTVVGGTTVYTEPQFATSVGLPQAGFRREPTWWWRGVPEDKNRRAGGGGGE
jgi:predicted amidohydrolase YtcJ